ncbi:tripartite tricarboxylate transporter substrate binding protein [Variovorax sp. OV329]|uniref:Bug family tripartite tricarboxylate transporter substrate binding protein n=1 Tax=Variovorax sp. OV329 TaxID=1882825 RepID=UPI0008EE0A0D|nr:tripartite tricarboxylate transporter substrate binding protein [Variovorax sp. OV329]SFM15283.1 Tripartite-type tricarboxylate transporter, receptor component TctC [Variovorax sp. OV329]
MDRFPALPRRLARCALVLGLVAPALMSGAAAAAQELPKTIKLVVPFAPGGAQDVIGRYLASQLASRLGTPVVVDNKAGAGGVIAADAVAKAPADGGTLLLATGGAISIAPQLLAKLPYKVQQDFAPIALVADTPMVLAVRSDSSYRTLPDLVKAASAQPGQVSYASTGNGTVSHLTGELFAQAAGVKLTHVPYRGASPATVDLLGGQVASIVTSAASIEPMVEGGKARVLATFTAAPISTLPGVPTVQQAMGLSGLAVPVWVGLMAPAKVPSSILERLGAEVLAICRLPETRARLQAAGAQSTCGGSAEFGRLIAEDSKRWERVVQRGNIKGE